VSLIVLYNALGLLCRIHKRCYINAEIHLYCHVIGVVTGLHLCRKRRPDWKGWLDYMSRWRWYIALCFYTFPGKLKLLQN